MPKSIGEQIKKARVRKKLKQDALGEPMHVTRSSVSHWETGHTLPDDDTLRQLEEILDCKFETEQEQEQSPEGQPIAALKTRIANSLCRKVPVWLCTAIAAGVFAVMLVIMLCITANLNGQLKAYENKYNANHNQPVAENTLAWYQQTVHSQDGKAYVTVEKSLILCWLSLIPMEKSAAFGFTQSPSPNATGFPLRWMKFSFKASMERQKEAQE